MTSQLQRRAPMPRGTGFKPAEPKPAAGPKLRKCAVRACRNPFQPRGMTHKACSPECAQIVAAQIAAAKRTKEQRQERATDRAAREGMKKIPELIAEAQAAFNLFIRLRDLAAGHGCICCGKFATAAALAKPGGAYDACHFRSRGSAGHLRFNEDNVHLGLKDCNTWGHVDYRGGLLRRIGLERLEALEANNAVHKWTHDELRGIRDTYRKRAAELKKGMAP